MAKTSPPLASTTARMKANRRTDSKPELAIRSELHRRGRRFRKDYAIRTDGLTVHVDVAFTKARVAIFIDGCFWHSCPEHGNVPKTNTEFWIEKFRRNARRDKLVTEALTESGWQVLRFWEHDQVEDIANRIEEALAQDARPGQGGYPAPVQDSDLRSRSRPPDPGGM